MSNQIDTDFEKKVREDPFNILWKNNYEINLRNNEFFKMRRYPVNLITMRTKAFNISPVSFLVNPGPSLEKNIQYLKIAKEKKGLIFSSDVCMYRLIDEGIIPDVVATVDPSNNIKRFIDEYLQYTEKILLVAPTTCNPEVIKSWKGPIAFFNQTDPHKWRGNFFKKLTRKTGDFGCFLNLTFVGGTLMQSAMLFRTKEMYLVGWDFASDENKNVYCKGFLDKRIHTNQQFNSEDEKKAFIDQLKEKEIKRLTSAKIEPKDTTKYPTLYTNEQLTLYKQIFLKVIIPDAIKLCKVVNCTEGGVLTEIPALKLSTVVENMAPQEIDFNEVLTKKFGSK